MSTGNQSVFTGCFVTGNCYSVSLTSLLGLPEPSQMLLECCDALYYRPPHAQVSERSLTFDPGGAHPTPPLQPSVVDRVQPPVRRGGILKSEVFIKLRNVICHPNILGIF